MNLKFSGLIFVLIVIVDTISGSRTVNATDVSHIEDLAAVTAVAEKSQAGNGAAESAKTIKPISSDVNLSKNYTKAATTTTTTTTTTTKAPSTTETTTSSPVTPAPPTLPPPPAPERGTWVIRNATTNMTCVIAQMAMQLNVTYPGKTKLVENAVVNVPKNATASGNCSDPTQAITISWGPGHSLKINFSENKTTNNYFVSGLDLSLNATVFNDAQVDKNDTTWHFANHTSEFQTPLQMSYKCSQKQDLNLTGEDPKLKAVLSLKDTQFEAYMNKEKDEFGAAQDCDTFDTPDIVPIAVGCALTVLVLVVLAAYLIGRRRSQNRGYLSM